MQKIEILINLIEAVKNHPKLFINSTPNFDDDNKEWTAVANKCNITITEAQDQWNQLLIEYVEYLRSNQNFSLAQQMDFLQPYFFTINDGENIDEEELLNAINSKRFGENNTLNIETKNEDESLNISSDDETPIRTEPTTKVKLQSTTFQENIESKTCSTACAKSQDSSFTNLSSLELIFLGYAKQLQKMPLTLQLKTKRKIADIMDEAELQMMS